MQDVTIFSIHGMFNPQVEDLHHGELGFLGELAINQIKQTPVINIHVMYQVPSGLLV